MTFEPTSVVEGAIIEELRPFVARRVRDPHDVDDVLQEIFLRMQRGLPQLRDEQRFGPWMYRLARNAIVDHARARSRRGLLVADVPDDAADPGSDEGDASRELASYVAFFVAMLPSPYREALTLTELEGLTQREAAEMLGVSLSTMKSRVQRGRTKLREALERCCEIALDARGRVMSYEPRTSCAATGKCCA
jgi:RNA polymerase sigma-70 factor, ECF subfamily